MKKTRISLLILVLVLLLAGCKQSRIYQVDVNGKQYSVDLTKYTIHDGTDTYTFSSHGAGTSSHFSGSVTFTYPNGATYQQHHERYGSVAIPTDVTVSDNYDDQRYTPGDVLYKCWQAARMQDDDRPTINYGRLAASIVLIVGGAFGAIFPEQAWYLATWRRRWMYQDADPTEAALVVQKFACIACIVIGVLVLMASFF